MNELGEIVWQSTLDQIYDCFVSRTGERTGQLRVVNMETKQVLLDQEVELSYGATFGPDVDDVAHWEELCTQTVDQASAQG